MPTDSCLRLLPKQLAQAIIDSTSSQRRRFATECAKLAVDHCTKAVFGASGAIESKLSELLGRTLEAIDTDRASKIDRELAVQENELYQQMTVLRQDEAAVDYSAFVKMATQRHAVRALRAALVIDGVSSAARAGFEAITVAKFDDEVMRIARITLVMKDAG